MQAFLSRFIACCLIVFAGTRAQAQDYLAYYRAVAVAEETLTQGRYDEALRQYQQASSRSRTGNVPVVFLTGDINFPDPLP